MDGLVVHLPRQGATIRGLDYAEIIELYEMRMVLEGTAARLAARVASPAEIDGLATIHAAFAAVPAGALAQDLNRQFHRTLLDAARNRFLLDAVQALEKTMLILGPSTMGIAGRITDAQAEHEAVLAALHARDADAAEALMRKHINAAHAIRLRQLRSDGNVLAETYPGGSGL